MNATITPAQLKRLQTLYSQYARRSLDAGSSREARIAWACQRTGRSVASYNDLTSAEAKELTDGLQRELGVQQTTAPRRQRKPKMQSRRDAHAAGTAGRHDADPAAETVMASAADLARIQYVLSLLGWDGAGLDNFLRSRVSPLRGRSNPQIRTQGDANKVYWSLKGIAKHKGVWKSEAQLRQERAHAA